MLALAWVPGAPPCGPLLLARVSFPEVSSSRRVRYARCIPRVAVPGAGGEAPGAAGKLARLSAYRMQNLLVPYGFGLEAPPTPTLQRHHLQSPPHLSVASPHIRRMHSRHVWCRHRPLTASGELQHSCINAFHPSLARAHRSGARVETAVAPPAAAAVAAEVVVVAAVQIPVRDLTKINPRRVVTVSQRLLVRLCCPAACARRFQP